MTEPYWELPAAWQSIVEEVSGPVARETVRFCVCGGVCARMFMCVHLCLWACECLWRSEVNAGFLNLFPLCFCFVVWYRIFHSQLMLFFLGESSLYQVDQENPNWTLIEPRTPWLDWYIYPPSLSVYLFFNVNAEEIKTQALILVWGALHCLKHLPGPASSLLKGVWRCLLRGRKCLVSQSYDNQGGTPPPPPCSVTKLFSCLPPQHLACWMLLPLCLVRSGIMSFLLPLVSSEPVMGYTPRGWSCMHWEAIFTLSIGTCIRKKKCF